ncbi:amidohydrolase [Halobacillus halophilus]|uniref:Aminoacylase n=1 Tax=Halobacillus halophilus (strain ATCC 35676 / DSM 2266 / JCM 20832 / KCTC 3685 / LMG 17431 / NBRC 102448 / NCIMB 2269) TaxID=866895 RepID=I0JSX9_HALH3|nr:amidohydrolase [Halobacillus halophilus]ASF41172.1 amidohydrolase [Halobacillus halophilus]CCG47251.1 aminoacylase [Halobacillus halophilus DSM 2266]
MRTKNADLVRRSQELHSSLVKWRRDFHQHPELSFQEQRTSRKVEEILREAGIEDIETNVGGYGLIATISNGPGAVIGVRADMDALPIEEETGFAWASKNHGVMHACGHDAHTAILLGVAHLFIEDAKANRFQGTVKFVFQPAEEKCDEQGETGAVKMLHSNKLEELDSILALHMCPWRKRGEVQIHDGPSMANNDEFHIAIKGDGGHAGYPHQTVDPVWISTFVLQNLYSLNGRKVDPLDVGTISIGKIRAGEANNIIPHEVEIRGTMRSYSNEVRYMLIHEINKIPSLVASLGGECDLVVQKGEPALYNAPEINAVFRKAAYPMTIYNEPFGMGSEDFSHFTQKIPGAMFFLGCATEKVTNLHQSDFNIDESAMCDGVRVLAESTYELLKQGGI